MNVATSTQMKNSFGRYLNIALSQGEVLVERHGKIVAKLVEAELERLKEENATLTSTKEKLEDPEYIQTYARGEYMFSKGDEKVFYLPSED